MTRIESEVLGAINRGRLYDLEQPRRAQDPVFPGHWPGFMFTLHRRHEAGLERRTSASGMLYMAEHSGTHIDALCHQAEDLHLYGGAEVTANVQTSAGFTELGVETIAPIVRHGVLLNLVQDSDLKPQSLVDAADLEQAAKRSRVVVTEGDVVLVRTGYGQYWEDPDRYLAAPGMSASASAWLGDRGVFAVGSDNVAWDLPGFVDPEIGTTLPGHVVLIVRRGIHIMENLFLEELAAHGVHEFLFLALPLKVAGGTGSPIRPVALAIDD